MNTNNVLFMVPENVILLLHRESLTQQHVDNGIGNTPMYSAFKLLNTCILIFIQCVHTERLACIDPHHLNARL